MDMRTIRTCLFAVMLFVFSGVSARAGELHIFELLIVGAPLLSMDDKDSMPNTEKGLHSKDEPKTSCYYKDSKFGAKQKVAKNSNTAYTMGIMSQRVIFLNTWLALSVNAGNGGIYFITPY